MHHHLDGVPHDKAVAEVDPVRVFGNPVRGPVQPVALYITYERKGEPERKRERPSQGKFVVEIDVVEWMEERDYDDNHQGPDP